MIHPWHNLPLGKNPLTDLEGKRVQTAGWEKSEVAMCVIADAIVRYWERYTARTGP